MAQYIGIEEITEQGKFVRRSTANFAPINQQLYEIADYREKYPWLASIDEYGTTIFNLLQTPHVVRELEELKKNASNPEVLNEIENTIKFIPVKGDLRFVKFLGD